MEQGPAERAGHRRRPARQRLQRRAVNGALALLASWFIVIGGVVVLRGLAIAFLDEAWTTSPPIDEAAWITAGLLGLLIATGVVVHAFLKGDIDDRAFGWRAPRRIGRSRRAGPDLLHLPTHLPPGTHASRRRAQ